MFFRDERHLKAQDFILHVTYVDFDLPLHVHVLMHNAALYSHYIYTYVIV